MSRLNGAAAARRLLQWITATAAEPLSHACDDVNGDEDVYYSGAVGLLPLITANTSSYYRCYSRYTINSMNRHDYDGTTYAQTAEL